MNKGELTEAVAAELGESKASAARAIEAVMNCITRGIQHGFGTFSKKQRAARMGRNPMTGEPLHIKASTTVGFKPSQVLKDSM